MINKIKQLISSGLIYPEYKFESNKSLKGKVILVTGASKGLGKALAEILYAEGASLALVARDQNSLKDFVSKMDSKKILMLAGDINDEAFVKDFIKKVTLKYGKIDCLVNNAGIFNNQSIESIEVKDFDELMGTNLKAVFLMCKTVLPIMKSRKSGLIINVGSKISHNSNIAPNKVAYATSKYALEGFSLSLGKELEKWGIKVTCVMPATLANFVSLKTKTFLHPYKAAEVINMIIKLEDVYFESVLYKSKDQSI